MELPHLAFKIFPCNGFRFVVVNQLHQPLSAIPEKTQKDSIQGTIPLNPFTLPVD